jgi:hypothetical protein
MDQSEKLPQEEINTILFNMLSMATVEDVLVGLGDAIQKREIYCRTNWPDQPETFEHLTENLVTINECLAKLSSIGKQRADDAKIERDLLLEQTRQDREQQDLVWKEREDAEVKPLLEKFVAVVAGRQFIVDSSKEDEEPKVSLDGVEIIGEERKTLDELVHTLGHLDHRDDVYDAFVACGLRKLKPKPTVLVPPTPLADSVTFMMQAIRDLSKFGATQDEIDKLLEVYALKGFDGAEDVEDANFERIALQKLDWLRIENMMGRKV